LLIFLFLLSGFNFDKPGFHFVEIHQYDRRKKLQIETFHKTQVNT